MLANPLASPGTIGVNSGAGVAAAICCAVAPTSQALVPIAAFIGAMAATLLVLFIAEQMCIRDRSGSAPERSVNSYSLYL